MSIRRRLRSRIASMLASPRTRRIRRRLVESRRRLARRPHVVAVFVDLDDPYSYLLSQYLADLESCYAVELHVYLVQAPGGDFRPQAELLAAYARTDCQRVALELGVPFLDRGPTPPVEYRRKLVDTLAHYAPGDSKEVLAAIRAYWRGDAEGVARQVGGASASASGSEALARNQALLLRLGHYESATLHYGGEWYWGIDRLHHLTRRLDELGLRRDGAATARLRSIRQAMDPALPVARPGAARELPALECFCSFRSPYSYLALSRVCRIADAFGLDLRIRAVLPMVMRNLPVPAAKIRYSLMDAAREAELHGLAFGRIVDPLGAGVERCMAVLAYAAAERRDRDFVLNACEAIWARGIDVATDKGLRKVTGRTGLFWPDVKAALGDQAWRESEEANRAALLEAGGWGVPGLRLGDFFVWGQDRDWLLVRHIEERCDTGEGILV